MVWQNTAKKMSFFGPKKSLKKGTNMCAFGGRCLSKTAYFISQNKPFCLGDGLFYKPK